MNLNTYLVPIVLMSSLVANSRNNEVLASFRAYLLALENEAAVPTGDLGSAPPPRIKIEILLNYLHWLAF